MSSDTMDAEAEERKRCADLVEWHRDRAKAWGEGPMVITILDQLLEHIRLGWIPVGLEVLPYKDAIKKLSRD